jgi:hypothetical protein
LTLALKAIKNIEPRVAGVILVYDQSGSDDGTAFLVNGGVAVLYGAHMTFEAGLLVGVGPLGSRPDEFGGRDSSAAIGLSIAPSYRFGSSNGSELGAVLYLIAGSDSNLIFPLLSFTQYFR